MLSIEQKSSVVLSKRLIVILVGAILCSACFKTIREYMNADSEIRSAGSLVGRNEELVKAKLGNPQNVYSGRTYLETSRGGILNYYPTPPLITADLIYEYKFRTRLILVFFQDEKVSYVYTGLT